MREIKIIVSRKFDARTRHSSKILLNGNYSIRSKVVRSNEWLCLNTNFSFY